MDKQDHSTPTITTLMIINAEETSSPDAAQVFSKKLFRMHLSSILIDVHFLFRTQERGAVEIESGDSSIPRFR